MATKSKGMVKFEKVMKEFSEGNLKSANGGKVTSVDQAQSIAFSEARELSPGFGKKGKK